MEYKVIYGSSPSELTSSVNKYLQEGWEISGSHQVQVIHSQNRYRGDQHLDTKHELEYSQTIVRHETR